MITGLETEVKTFDSQRGKLLANSHGKWVVIKGERIVGLYEAIEEAFRAGYREFGNEPFLVKQVVETEEPVNFYGNNLGI